MSGSGDDDDDDNEQHHSNHNHRNRLNSQTTDDEDLVDDGSGDGSRHLQSPPVIAIKGSHRDNSEDEFDHRHTTRPPAPIRTVDDDDFDISEVETRLPPMIADDGCSSFSIRWSIIIFIIIVFYG